MFAQTGSAVLPRFLGAGVSAVSRGAVPLLLARRRARHRPPLRRQRPVSVTHDAGDLVAVRAPPQPPELLRPARRHPARPDHRRSARPAAGVLGQARRARRGRDEGAGRRVHAARRPGARRTAARRPGGGVHLRHPRHRAGLRRAGARPSRRAGRRQRTGAVHAAVAALLRGTAGARRPPGARGRLAGGPARPAARAAAPDCPEPTGPTSTTTPTTPPVTPRSPPNSPSSSTTWTSWCAASAPAVTAPGSSARCAGTGRALRLIGVDSIGSTIFGQPARPRLMRGLGSSIHPRNVAYDAFDEVHWVGPAEAVDACRRLARGSFVSGGWSTGAVALVAAWAARVQPGRRRRHRLPGRAAPLPRHRLRRRLRHAHGLDPATAAVRPVEIPHPGAAEAIGWVRCSTVTDPLGHAVPEVPVRKRAREGSPSAPYASNSPSRCASPARRWPRRDAVWLAVEHDGLARPRRGRHQRLLRPRRRHRSAGCSADVARGPRRFADPESALEALRAVTRRRLADARRP